VSESNGECEGERTKITKHKIGRIRRAQEESELLLPREVMRQCQLIRRADDLSLFIIHKMHLDMMEIGEKEGGRER
jgi:hypothetical protein